MTAAHSKNWFTRFRPAPTQQGRDNGDRATQLAIRPKTAPSLGTGIRVDNSNSLEPPLIIPHNRSPPQRPPRPNSTVIHDVNAWLEASVVRPAPAIMGGLPYWRDGSIPGAQPALELRYAIPVIKAPEVKEPCASHSDHIKFFCRRAAKMQVRMPSLLRVRSQRGPSVQTKQIDRRSTSVPLLLAPKETSKYLTANVPPSISRSRSLMEHVLPPSIDTTSRSGWLAMGRHSLVCQSRGLRSAGRARFREQESRMELRVNAVFGQTSIRHFHPYQSIARDNSVGNLSDAPTYSSGMPPPSYRSRAASVRTTSSFGCVDGLTAERRLISQRRAARRNQGVKAKLRKLAQKTHLTK